MTCERIEGWVIADWEPVIRDEVLPLRFHVEPENKAKHSGIVVV